MPANNLIDLTGLGVATSSTPPHTLYIVFFQFDLSYFHSWYFRPYIIYFHVTTPHPTGIRCILMLSSFSISLFSLQESQMGLKKPIRNYV